MTPAPAGIEALRSGYPTEIELRDWRALRSLPRPGPDTLRIVYVIAFPVLLDAYDRLTKENAALRSQSRALAERDAEVERLRQSASPRVRPENGEEIDGQETHRTHG